MKKLILSLLCFFTLAFVSSIGAVIIVRTAPPGGGGECGNYLVCQNFEGTGYDNGESWTETGATNDPDEAVVVLRGSQSFMQDMTAATPESKISFGNTDPVYGFLLWRIDLDNSEDVITIEDSSNNDCFRLWKNDTQDHLRVYCGTNWSEASTTTINPDTTYYIWWEYHKGTGANAVCKIWVSTSTTKPATPEIDKTDGNSTYTANKVNLLTYGTSEIYRDQVYVDDAQIGDVNP